MMPVLLGGLLGIGAFFLIQPLAKRRALRRLTRARVGQCERCAVPMDPKDRFVIEGEIVCGACAARTRHRAKAAIWGLLFIGVIGALFGALGAWASWRRGEHPSLWSALVLVFMFPVLVAGGFLIARLLGRYLNHSRLRQEAAEADVLERLAEATWSDPPGPGA